MMRRIVACCCILALAVIVMADVRAQDYSQCNVPTATNALCPDRGAAVAAAKASAQHYCSQLSNCNGLDDTIETFNGSDTWSYRTRYRYGEANNGSFGVYKRTMISCPAGHTWNAATMTCDSGCNSKPPMTNVRFQVAGGIAGSACSGGCEYIVDLQSGSGPAGLTTIGGVQFYRAPSMVPSGSTCTNGNQPITNDSEACATQGNLTQCVKPDGQHCATASSGKQFCWQPGENGIKASGNDAATKSPDGTTPKPPPLPPNNGGEWTQTGQSTVTTTINDTTQTSNVTGWQSSYGSQGQGANGNGASGEGNSGSGSGSGLGNGNGNGDDEGDDDGPGSPGAGVDDLYTPTDKTIASVFAAFKARVGESPLVDAIDGFFTVNASGGCATWTVPASEYWDSMTWDKHCSGDMLSSLQAIGFVLMAIAAFLAAIWALS
ncbi:hypothetical protein [Pseudoxanthomonas sp. SE1]|uniref:hypothetical protein n=1 Tax=Pseudoxanthomonas sp. SE1 TaxID=1664560 RepID=UPI00240D35A4|nr:hypothetical protein [Pseudoxanthomonas sp. SE1]WFC43781.1 hypothetical protein OY559_09925 [Pseudoxanthomonas sp. SE1]